MGFNICVILISVFLLLFSGTWLSIALFGTGVIALTFLGKGGMAHVLESVMYNAVASYSLVAIPLFVLMGEILIESGCSKQIFRGVKRILKPFPGGMLHANIVACSIFAAWRGVGGADSKLQVSEQRCSRLLTWQMPKPSVSSYRKSGHSPQ